MSKAITDKPESSSPQLSDWKPLQESAPSLIRVDEPAIGRVVGFVGLMLLALGGTALLLNALNVARGIGPLLGSIAAIGGVALLLFHAVCDNDLQIRRIYGLVGFLWLAVGIILSIIPWRGQPVFGNFLPFGYASGWLALFFLLPFGRHETDEKWRLYLHVVLGAGGAMLALVGLIGGTINVDFLNPNGFLLALLGLAYLWAFLGFEGTASDRGYKTGLAIGAVGIVVFVIALARSLFASSIDPYFVPNGLILMAVSGLFVAMSAGICLDFPFIVLTRRDLASFFFSPIAYFVLLGVAVVACISFSVYMLDILRAAEAQQPFIEPVIQEYLLGLLPVIYLVFMVPVLTMRQFSEERRTGSLELLFTAPLGEAPVVLSKFTATFIFYMLVWMLWSIFPISLRVANGEPFEYRPLLTFYVFLACVGINFLAMGLFFSSLTKNQIVAAVLTFAGMLGWTGLYFIWRNLAASRNPLFNEPLANIVNHVSFINLWVRTVEGVVYPQFLIFHISAGIFWLFLTAKVLEARKWL